MLKVWLPLTGDLHNQGVSDVTATGHSVTSIAEGKIGSCYQFTTSAIELDDNIFDNSVTEFTIAAWMKFNNSNSACLFSDRTVTNSTGITCFIMDSGGIFFDVGNRWQFTPSIAIPRNQWFHITFLYKKESLRQVYLNGILVGSTTSAPAPTTTSTGHSFIGASQSSSTAFGGNYFNGWMNDVRIYDHCLSAAEVKEIAQGLVLHYKLDGGLFGNPNLALDTNTTTNRWNLSMQTGDKTNSIEYENNIPISVITRGSTAQSGWRFLGYTQINRNAIKTATNYTVSFDIKATVAGTIGFTGIVRSNATDYLTASTSVVQNTVVADQWCHIILQCRTKDSFDGLTIDSQIIYLAPSANFYNTSVVMKFKNMKFEEGSVATPWCPADSELSIDRTIVEDSSGYGHNGTIVGNISPVSDTSRYTTSLSYPANSELITISPCFSNNQTLDTITVNCWFKTNTTNGTTPNIFCLGQNSFLRSRIASATSIWSYYRVGTTQMSETNTCKTLTDNIWHMLTFRFDKGIERIFIDGDPIGTQQDRSSTATYLTCASQNWYLGGYTGSSEKFIGSLSDFRIYCTPLLDTEIKQLYNVSMKIDKKQNIHNFEIIEDGQNKITKKGQLKCANIIEYISGQAYRGPQNDPNIYIEPDGSCWIRIFHHNNPASYLFMRTDNFLTNVYKDENRWFNFNICDSVHEHEFIARVKRTTNDTERVYRWIQSTDPLTATFDQTKVANITKISGYDTWPLGGLYKLNSSTYLTANNGTNGNWFGATGCWTAWNGGIPGWASTSANDAITTGYVDIYLRIDSDVTVVSNVPNTVQSKKNNLWLALEAIER